MKPFFTQIEVLKLSYTFVEIADYLIPASDFRYKLYSYVFKTIKNSL